MANSVKVQIEILAKDLTQAAISGVKGALGGVKTAMEEVGKAAVAMGAAILAFTKFAEAGERDVAITDRFRGAMEALGLSSDVVLKRLTAASGGLLQQNDVMKSATSAMRDGKFTLDQTALAME